MNHLRGVLAVVLLFAILCCLTAPAAQALPLRRPPSSQAHGGTWLDAALSWLSQVFFPSLAAPATVPARSKIDSTRSTTTKPSSDPRYRPLGTPGPENGACIDPNGCTSG